MPNPGNLTNPKETIPTPDPTDRTVEALRRDLQALRELLDARMEGTDKLNQEKFAGRDLALTAALAAAKAAVDKSEIATTKQIDLVLVTMKQTKEAADESIKAVEARLDRGDGKIVGQAYTSTNSQQNSAFVFSIIAALVSIAGLIIALTVLFRH